jgi:excisionase family DNA binding protein
VIAKTRTPAKPQKPAVAVTPVGELLTTEQVAEKLKVSTRFLKSLRIQKRNGPKFVMVGNRVRYDSNEIERWLEANSQQY